MADCVSEMSPASAASTAQVMLQAQKELSSVAFQGMPSVGSVEGCELPNGRELYILTGRNYLGCFLGNQFTLMIEVKTPRFMGDSFDYTVSYSEGNS